MAIISAAAQPEKRLFISLITRDISLIDALLDIVDNSINAALEPMASKLVTADDYQKLLAKKTLKPKVTVRLTVSATRIEVSDDASGISSIAAKSDIFKFGKDESGPASSDRLPKCPDDPVAQSYLFGSGKHTIHERV